MHRSVLFLMVAASACANGGVAGDWEGDCTLTAANDNVVEWTFAATIDQEGDSLNGTAQDDQKEHAWSIHGTRAGDDVDLSLKAVEEGNTLDLELYVDIVGTIDQDTLSGTGDYWTVAVGGEEPAESAHFGGPCTWTQL